jgi:hypothetical protein
MMLEGRGNKISLFGLKCALHVQYHCTRLSSARKEDISNAPQILETQEIENYALKSSAAKREKVVTAWHE